MSNTLIHNLLENSNGRQRRAIVICIAAIAALLLATLLLRAEDDNVYRSSSNASGTLRVALYDPLFSRFDTPPEHRVI